MAKLAKRAKKEHSDNHEFLQTEPKEIETLSLAQKKYLNVIKNNILTFATGCAGTGKAQPLDEPVLTPSGFVPMGDIEKGDFVVSEEGQPIRVLDTFINDNLKMYKLTFSDGSTTNCCEDHLWEIQTPKLASMKRYKVMPLSEMLDGINIDKSKKASYKYRVRLTKPVEFLKNDNQEIDAWTMGYILGNGSSTNYNLIITVGSHDFEEILSKIAPDVIMSYRRKVNGVYDIAVNKEHRHLYDLLGLHDVKSIDKWIPDNYKYGSIAQRKALLAGLLDSDGSCANNKLRFSSSSKKLIDDVTWLVRSLGGIATITINDRTPSKNIEYGLQIRTPFNPFSLKRKAEGYKVLATDICANKRIVKAEYIGIQTGKCISVDSERHLYLTRDFTVTHNTYIALSYAAEQLKAKRISKIIITRPLVETGEKLGYLPGPQPLDTKIAIPNGWTTMGELQIGDYVIGKNGKPIEVLNIFPKGEKDVYRIITTDGTSTECCADHLWFTTTAKERKQYNDHTVNTSPYIGSVKSTFDIAQTLLTKNGKINHHLPRHSAVEYNTINVDIPAYDFECSMDDTIPNEYKYNSIDIRLDILNNVIEQFGTTYEDIIHFDNIPEPLTDDIIEIVRSLGGHTNKGIKNKHGKYNFIFDMSDILYPKYNSGVGIATIEYVGKKEVQCILVNAEDHLYLTDHFLVTHNTMEEKISPYFDPTIAILNKRLGQSYTDYLIKRNIIEAKPLAYLRGSTFENAMVILDESQNTTPTQMLMFLTRIGENCKMIVDGDLAQSDIRGESGLHDALSRLKQVNNVGHIHFTIDDVVRSGICKDILIAYGKPKPKLEDTE